MKVIALLIGVATLTGCATSAYHQRRALAIDGMSARWGACIEAEAWQWLDDRNDSVPDEVKQLRTTLTAAQMLVRTMDHCRDHLASGDIAKWDQLDDSEIRQFFREAAKRFGGVSDEIETQRTLEEI